MSNLWPIDIPLEAQPDVRAKKVLFGGGDRLALFPLAHEWAWEYYQIMQQNHWRPNEIPMGGDIACWASGLTDAERRLFFTVFGQLTTFDLLRAKDASGSIQQVTSSAEIALALQWVTAQEGIHGESYQLCVDSLELSYGETYGLYKAVPALKARVEYAESISRDMEEAVQEGDHEDIARAAILSTVFWYQFFEGVWFVANLSGPVQHLARIGKMMATAEQFRLILRDEIVHVALGTKMFRSLINENPKAWDDKMRADIYTMVDRVIKLEDEFIKFALPEPMMGYLPSDHMIFARQLANRRLKAIGLEPSYEKAPHPFPWIDEMTGGTHKEANFFEVLVNDYQKSSLGWEDGEENRSGIDLWDSPLDGR